MSGIYTREVNNRFIKIYRQPLQDTSPASREGNIQRKQIRCPAVSNSAWTILMADTWSLSNAELGLVTWPGGVGIIFRHTIVTIYPPVYLSHCLFLYTFFSSPLYTTSLIFQPLWQYSFFSSFFLSMPVHSTAYSLVWHNAISTYLLQKLLLMRPH